MMDQTESVGRVEQHIEKCPFCSLQYDLRLRKIIEPCYGCKLPLLPKQPSLAQQKDYLERLNHLKPSYEGTQYQETVEAQIFSVEISLLKSRAFQPSMPPEPIAAPESKLAQATMEHLKKPVEPPKLRYYPLPSWIDTYNRSPDKLSGRCISVDIPESIIAEQRIGRSQSTQFEESTLDDDYWVIRSGDDKYDYLVPKRKFFFSSHTTDIAAIIFDFERDDRTDLSKFSLIQPAIVIPTGDRWELVQKGKLEFERKYLSNDESYSLPNFVKPQIEKAQPSHPVRLEKPLEKPQSTPKNPQISELESWVQKQSKDLQAQLELEKSLRLKAEAQLKRELHQHQCQIDQITQTLKELQSALDQFQKQPPKPSAPDSPIASPPADPRIPWWLEQYNRSPKDVTAWAIQVEETSSSFQQRNGYARSSGSSKAAVTFEKQSGTCNFLIIPSDEIVNGTKIAYLVPRWNAKFNGHDQQSLQAFFASDEAEGKKGDRYRVIRPAWVAPLPQGEQWELVERGELELQPGI
jgi:hypothetical protein